MGTFIAHMHPALVHLPIGFIIMSLLVDFFQRSGNKRNSKLSTYMWGASAIASLLAMGTGIVALRSGYYEGLNMFIHLLCGYGTAIACVLLWWFKKSDRNYFGAQNGVLKFILGGTLLVGGHMGGELTHGEQYMPLPFSGGEKEKPDLNSKDSIGVYADLIAPIFAEKCNRCHEDLDARGRLNMTTQEGLLTDKFGDPAIAPGDLKNSAAFKRMTLHPEHKKYMPPSGPPITYNEQKLIEWWIRNNAPFEKNLRSMKLSDEMKEFFAEEYGIDLKVKSFYEKFDIGVLPNETISNIRNVGFNVSRLAQNNNFIDVSTHGQDGSLDQERIDQLLQAKEHITWLDLSGAELTDDHMTVIGQLQNLTRLNINNTKITDQGIAKIGDLHQLSSLNVYGTKITDESIATLKQLKNLKSLYLWQTKLSDKGVADLKSSLNNCDIVTGAE